MMRKIKLTRANKSILLKALAPYYYQQRALGHSTENPGRLILKIDSVPADKKATFSTEEIRLMRITINRLRNERLRKGQYTDAADDMLLKLFWKSNTNKNKKPHCKKHIAMRFSGATGRIRTSGLPGRRTTTSPYRPTLKREFCWFCTVASKARKRLLVVVTTGFSVFYGASAQ